MVANLAGGAIDYAMGADLDRAGAHRGGHLAALGVTTAKRSPALPDVPTIAEAGVARYDFPIWYGVWAPSRTPSEIVEGLAEDVASAISEPEVHAWLVSHGMDPDEHDPRSVRALRGR